MRKFYITIFTLFIMVVGFGQSLTEKDLVGEWEPVTSTNISGDAGHNSLAKNFKETLFEFKANHTMNVQSLSGSFLITMYMTAVNKGKWGVNPKTKLVEVKDGMTEKVLLTIKAYKENGKTFFIIDKGIKIEVKKI